MRLIQPELENVCQYRKLTVDWHHGTNGIVGPNGIGKSNLLKAVRFSYTGTFDNHGVKEDNIHWRAGPGATSRVVNRFTHLGHDYELVRYLQGGKSQLRGTGELITGEKNVTGAIEEKLGVSVQAISRHVFVPQRGLSDLIVETPSERAAALARLFGTQKAESVTDLVSKQINQLGKIGVPDAAAIDALERRLADTTMRLREAEAALKLLPVDLEPRLAAARQQLASAGTRAAYTATRDGVLRDLQAVEERVAVAERAAVSAKVHHASYAKVYGEAETQASNARSLLEDAAGARSRNVLRGQVAGAVGRLDAELAQLQAPQCPVLPAGVDPDQFPDEELKRAGLKRDELVARQARYRRLLDSFKGGAVQCPTCGTSVVSLGPTLDEAVAGLPRTESELVACDDYSAQLRQFHQARREFVFRHKQLTEQRRSRAAELDALGPLESTLSAEDEQVAREYLTWYEDLGQKLSAAREGLGRAETAEAHERSTLLTVKHKLQQAEASLAQVPAPDSSVTPQLVAQLETQQREAAGLRATVETLKVQAAPLEGELAGLADARRRGEAERIWLDRLEQLRKLLPRAARRVAEKGLKAVERRANQDLVLFQADFQVRVGPQLSFDAVFADGKVQAAPRLSVGQAALLALAARVALNALYAGIGLLGLDELTEGLDEFHRQEAIGAALGRLRELSLARSLQCLVVTHEQSLAGLFDQVIDLGSLAR
ncbi:MAG TPA: AAA family ATPase [Gemmatimonadales bacterium]|nr:AAA family ATPase [Gemmatimonadales bacterium]